MISIDLAIADARKTIKSALYKGIGKTTGRRDFALISRSSFFAVHAGETPWLAEIAAEERMTLPFPVKPPRHGDAGQAETPVGMRNAER